MLVWVFGDVAIIVALNEGKGGDEIDVTVAVDAGERVFSSFF